MGLLDKILGTGSRFDGMVANQQQLGSSNLQTRERSGFPTIDEIVRSDLPRGLQDQLIQRLHGTSFEEMRQRHLAGDPLGDLEDELSGLQSEDFETFDGVRVGIRDGQLTQLDRPIVSEDLFEEQDPADVIRAVQRLDLVEGPDERDELFGADPEVRGLQRELGLGTGGAAPGLRAALERGEIPEELQRKRVGTRLTQGELSPIEEIIEDPAKRKEIFDLLTKRAEGRTTRRKEIEEQIETLRELRAAGATPQELRKQLVGAKRERKLKEETRVGKVFDSVSKDIFSQAQKINALMAREDGISREQGIALKKAATVERIKNVRKKDRARIAELLDLQGVVDDKGNIIAKTSELQITPKVKVDKDKQVPVDIPRARDVFSQAFRGDTIEKFAGNLKTFIPKNVDLDNNIGVVAKNMLQIAENQRGAGNLIFDMPFGQRAIVLSRAGSADVVTGQPEGTKPGIGFDIARVDAQLTEIIDRLKEKGVTGEDLNDVMMAILEEMAK